MAGHPAPHAFLPAGDLLRKRVTDNDEAQQDLRSSHGDSGNLRIEPRQAEEWKTVIKNVRAEGGAILFDEYRYTPPSDRLKTEMSRTGDHPFSGVRCIVELTSVHGDPEKLRHAMSTIQMSEPIVTILKRQESVQDVP